MPEKFEFYKESKFRNTDIGPLPEEWEVVRLGDVFDMQRGYSYRKSDLSDDKTHYRFITINDFEKEGGLKRDAEPIYLNEDVNIDSKFFVNGKVLFVANTDMSKGMIIGAPILVSLEHTEEKLIFSMDLTRLIPKSKVDLNYFYHLLKYPIIRKVVKTFAQGTNVLHLNHGLMKNLTLPLPPLPEQKRIARVLADMDEAIEAVAASIESLERLKRGLMQHLLTRGIGHEKFKKTEIGEIPEEWGVVRLGEVANIRGNKTVNNVDKVAVIPMELVPDNGVFVSYKIIPKNDVKSSTYCEAGDVLLAKITPSLENGKQGIVPLDIPNGFAMATTEVFPIAPYDDKLDRFFLFYILKFNKFRQKIIASMTGTTGRQRAAKKSVINLQIPLPPLPEQKRIAEILSSVDEALELKREKKEKLERMKKELMNLLLTGRVRIRGGENGEDDAEK